MSVQYKDYYKSLGVEKTASADEIKKAYRKLAAKHHPDRNPGDKKAEDRFKEISEAYEVLKDPEKRQRYDQLGSAGFHGGQSINPEDIFSMFSGMGGGGFGRPGAGNVRFETFTSGRGARGGRRAGGAGGFSDFFETLFGGGAGMGGAGASPFGAGAAGGDPFGRASAGPAASAPDQHVETSLTISLEEAYRGTTRKLSFRRTDAHGQVSQQEYEVRIPAGIRPGQKVRLKGQGHASHGRSGDILIAVNFAPGSRFHLEGEELHGELALAPWEAALGAKVAAHTPEGEVDVRVPPGIQAGKKLRVRGRGWPKRDGSKGDLFLAIQIQNPPDLTIEERELYERLAKISRFKPRG